MDVSRSTGSMTKYDEISEAFRRTLPRRLALSSAIEQLPARLRDAVHRELAPPVDRAQFLSAMHNRDVSVVYLARLVADENGRNKYVPCEPDEAMFRDYDGVWNFRLGLAIEGDGTTPYMIHWLIALENVSEEVLTLKIVGAPGTVDIRIGDADSLAAAAQRICEWMIALQSDVSASLGDSAPIGFRGQR